MWTLILLAIYISSVIKMYIYFKNSYSIGGQWSNLDAPMDCIWFTFIPIVNTIFSLMALFDSGKRDGDKLSFNKFFNVKK